MKDLTTEPVHRRFAQQASQSSAATLYALRRRDELSEQSESGLFFSLIYDSSAHDPTDTR